MGKFKQYLAEYKVEVELSDVHKILGNAYAVIFEAKALGIFDKPEEELALTGKKKAIEVELGKVTKYTKAWNIKVREYIHATIMKEANTLLVDS